MSIASLAAATALTMAGAASAAPAAVTPKALPVGTQTRPFAFARLVLKLPAGTVWSTGQTGAFCQGAVKVTWPGGQKDVAAPSLVDAFRTTMSAAGFKVDGDTSNLFERPTSTSDYLIGGTITALDLTYCLPAAPGDKSAVRGEASMDIEWQIYSTLQKTLLGKVATHGEMQIKKTGSGGVDALMTGAFTGNVDALIAADAFRKTFIGAPVAPGDVTRPTAQSPIPLPGALAATGRPIGEAVGAVVLIFAGQGQGSAFLASSNGLLLTDRHVVGEAKYVKVRWPDGIETLGEVVRDDKIRDVALIKTDPRGRRPLKLRRDPLQPGDTVYAIGAPLGEKFQSTVTRGVVSANRVFEGLAFIQSDVAVNPGSSGGPLLDDKGAVVGMTESGYRVAGAPVEINLFTPLGDALDFLNAQPK